MNRKKHGVRLFVILLLSLLSLSLLKGQRMSHLALAYSYQSVSVSADTEVCSGQPNTNYGSQNDVDIGYNGVVFKNCSTWLKFDLSSVASYTIEKAEVYLYCNGKVGDTLVDIWFSSNDSWAENTITYNNQPKVNSGIINTTNVNAVGQWFIWPVTGHVHDEVSGDKTVSFKLNSTTATTYATFWSHEGSAPFAPHLYVTCISGLPAVKVYFVTGQALAFQNNVDQHVTLKVETGNLNSTTNSFALDGGGGHFRFTARENTQIKLTYSVSTVRVSGDKNNAFRALSSGSVFSVDTGDNVLVQWDILVEPFFPVLFVLGMCGLIGMIGGPTYAAHLVKHKKYYEGFRFGVIVTVVGMSLFIAWLWPLT